MDRILRPVVPGSLATWFAPDQLPVLVEIAQPFCSIASPLQFVSQSHLGKLADSGRLQVDADAQRREVAYGLVYADRNARLVQTERQAKPADSRPNDDDLHVRFYLSVDAADRTSLDDGCDDG